MKETSGIWNPDESYVFFLAASPIFIEMAGRHHPWCLTAVNELMHEDWRKRLDHLIESGHKILIDSGAYAIASAHASFHRLHIDQAFKMPLDELDGFTELWTRYIEVAKHYKDQVWGMIEVDLGGTAQKKKTRKKLEDMGLAPIPVLHVLNDPSDYIDELLEGYDRICAGTLVGASRYVRRRILATLTDRRKGKACRWIHLLGVTPSEMLCAFPFESSDSSAWLNTVRWSGYVEKACLRSVGHLPKNFQYQLGDKESWSLGVQMGAIGAAFQQRNFRNYLVSMR